MVSRAGGCSNKGPGGWRGSGGLHHDDVQIQQQPSVDPVRKMDYLLEAREALGNGLSRGYVPGTVPAEG